MCYREERIRESFGCVCNSRREVHSALAWRECLQHAKILGVLCRAWAIVIEELTREEEA